MSNPTEGDTGRAVLVWVVGSDDRQEEAIFEWLSLRLRAYAGLRDLMKSDAARNGAPELAAAHAMHGIGGECWQNPGVKLHDVTFRYPI
jgi:hypothetical protein